MDKFAAFVEDYGAARLAQDLGVTPSAVSSWKAGRWKVKGNRCLAIEHLSAGKVTRYDLRPDIFGEPNAT